MPKIVRSTDELITNNITGALLPASGTTGERPSVPIDGQIRYNTTTPGLEAYVDSAWSTLAAGSGLGSFVRRDGDTMAGTLTFLDGNQLIIDETGTVSAPAITFDGDLDTGIYQNAGNIVGITGQGANVVLFDGSVTTPVNYLTFSSAATANAPIVTNAGSDTNGVGLGITILGKTASAAGDGGPIVITGGAGDTAGVGGVITLIGGIGGATGTGGAASLTGGDSAGGSGTAGSVIIDAGDPVGGTAGSVTIAGTDATTLTLAQTSFPVVSTAIGILALTAANTLTAVNAATGGATVQFLQFDDSSDTFSWENLETTFKGFSVITDDASTTITAEFQDDLLLSGASNGGITTVATDNPEVVTFSITPTDLTTTGATIASADFMIVSDSGDAITVIGQKVTFASAFDDMGVPYIGSTFALETGANNGIANTGVTVTEYGDGYNHVTVMTVSQVDALTLGDAVSLADGYLLYTFPTGVCVIESTHMSMALTAGSAQLQSDTPDVGLGTTIASGAFATLDSVASTAEDIITGQTADDSNGTEEDITLLPTAAVPFIIQDGETRTLYFNVANSWSDDTTPDLTADISGIVIINWTFLGA